MTNIALTAPVRGALLSLQASAAQRAETQARLATGLKARSMVQDPINYSTAGALNARANDLSGLMDGFGRATSAIKTSIHAVEASRKLVAEMRATIEAEIVDPSTAVEDFKTTIFGAGGWAAGDTIGVANNNTFNLTVADTTDNAAFNRTQFTYGNGGTRDGTTIQDYLDKLSTSPLVEATLEGGTLRFDSSDGRAFFITQSGSFIPKSGFLRGAYWAGDETTQRVVTGWKTGLTPTTTMGSIGGGGNQTNAFQSRDSSGALQGASVTKGSATTVQQVIDQINADPDFGFTAQLTGDGRFQFVSKPDADVMSFHMPSGGNLHGALGVVDGSGGGLMPTLSLSEKKVVSERWPTFDDLRNQLDDVVRDSGFAGSTRAAGDIESVVLNDRGTRLTLSSGLLSMQSLGLADLVSRDFADQDSLEAALTEIDEAERRLEIVAGRLTRDLGVLSIRETFTKDLMNVLVSGASELVLADTNEEGANLRAIDTRERITSASLSFVANADRDVLQLFR